MMRSRRFWQIGRQRNSGLEAAGTALGKAVYIVLCHVRWID